MLLTIEFFKTLPPTEDPLLAQVHEAMVLQCFNRYQKMVLAVSDTAPSDKSAPVEDGFEEAQQALWGWAMLALNSRSRLELVSKFLDQNPCWSTDQKTGKAVYNLLDLAIISRDPAAVIWALEQGRCPSILSVQLFFEEVASIRRLGDQAQPSLDSLMGVWAQLYPYVLQEPAFQKEAVVRFFKSFRGVDPSIAEINASPHLSWSALGLHKFSDPTNLDAVYSLGQMGTLQDIRTTPLQLAFLLNLPWLADDLLRAGAEATKPAALSSAPGWTLADALVGVVAASDSPESLWGCSASIVQRRWGCAEEEGARTWASAWKRVGATHQWSEVSAWVRQHQLNQCLPMAQASSSRFKGPRF